MNGKERNTESDPDIAVAIRQVLICILVIFLQALPVGAAVVAAENLPPGPQRTGGGSGGVGGVYGNGYYPGVYYQSFMVQTFVAEESGVLHSVSLVVQNHSVSEYGAPLVVSLVSILGDVLFFTKQAD